MFIWGENKIFKTSERYVFFVNFETLIFSAINRTKFIKYHSDQCNVVARNCVLDSYLLTQNIFEFYMVKHDASLRVTCNYKGKDDTFNLLVLLERFITEILSLNYKSSLCDRRKAKLYAKKRRSLVYTIIKRLILRCHVIQWKKYYWNLMEPKVSYYSHIKKSGNLLALEKWNFN